jgi:hypothetical protein
LPEALQDCRKTSQPFVCCVDACQQLLDFLDDPVLLSDWWKRDKNCLELSFSYVRKTNSSLRLRNILVYVAID